MEANQYPLIIALFAILILIGYNILKYKNSSKKLKKDYWHILREYYIYFILSFLFLILWIFFDSGWYKLFFGVFLIIPWIIEGYKKREKI